jgi:6-phosphogluconolactonase
MSTAGVSSATAQHVVRDAAPDATLQWHHYSNQATLTHAVAEMLEHEIRFALAERDVAWLALAGGRTPLPAYRELAQATLDWRHVRMVLSDDRWVPRTHPASNARAVQEAFQATAMQLAHLVPELSDPFAVPASSFHASRVLAAFPQDFDVVLLGMGEDGHFASLFPNAAEHHFDAERVESAFCLTPDPLPPEAPFARVSLSLPRLLRSRHIALLITGAAKQALLQARRTQALPIDHLIAACRARGRTLDVYWSPT